MNSPARPSDVVNARLAREKKAREDQFNEVEDLRWIMRDARGRRYIARLLDECGVNRTTFTGNSDMFRLEGRRQIGLEELERIKEHAFDEFLTMLKEQL